MVFRIVSWCCRPVVLWQLALLKTVLIRASTGKWLAPLGRLVGRLYDSILVASKHAGRCWCLVYWSIHTLGVRFYCSQLGDHSIHDWQTAQPWIVWIFHMLPGQFPARRRGRRFGFRDNRTLLIGTVSLS